MATRKRLPGPVYMDWQLLFRLRIHARHAPMTWRAVAACDACPAPSTYVKRFGSWRQACQLAGVRCGEPFGLTHNPEVTK